MKARLLILLFALTSCASGKSTAPIATTVLPAPVVAVQKTITNTVTFAVFKTVTTNITYTTYVTNVVNIFNFTNIVTLITNTLVQAAPVAVVVSNLPALDNFATNTPLPEPAWYSLAIPTNGQLSTVMLTPTIAEASLVQVKPPDPAPLPVEPEFIVQTNEGIKRRVLYAPLAVRDLRVQTSIYIQSPLPFNWPAGLNPALHVNQIGYMPALPKKAIVGYYLGTLGELQIPTNVFQIIDTGTGACVFTGTLTLRQDVGYSYTPKPYQNVYEADFSALTTPGQYRLAVPGMGYSLPFAINDGVAATIARTYALGLYHQRSGTNNVLPYTRYTRGVDHVAPAQIPVTNSFVDYTLNQDSGGQMTNVGASFYPFVNQGTVDVSGGHFDAGDYSKYTVDVAYLIHDLLFAVDNLPGVAALDNLGIPESGDGISDVLQEAKWESDFLAKMQDADGGFYFLVYPVDRPYELNVTPDHGDAQVVFPKNTVSTAAAVAALAEMASSPAFKTVWPQTSSNYLAQAVRGWQFLTNAYNKYGRAGAYQKITFYGDTFADRDELAWAAAALYAATGDTNYDNELRTHTPNPNDAQYRQWTWWSMYAGYGCAFRDYAFAARSGRLPVSALNPTYVAACEGEVRFAATNAMNYSAKMAYGSSFSDENKGPRTGGWYFSGEQTFDLAAAYALEPKADYIEVILRNYNYELGCNPVNMSYVTGLGWNRQHQIVDQYAQNDGRALPPDGIPLGNIQAGYDWLQLYGSELSAMSVPSDSTNVAPYPYYDRWSDTFNTTTEFSTYQQAKSLAAAAMLMAGSNIGKQAWNSAFATVRGIPVTTPVGSTLTLSASAPGLDLRPARITWEGFEQDPGIGAVYKISPKHPGAQWIEMEALMPDGRRVFAQTNFNASVLVTNTIEQYQSNLATDTNVLAWYNLDGSYTNARGAGVFTPTGGAAFDNATFTWSNRTNGQCVRVHGLGDELSVPVPNTGHAFSIEAMIYVNDTDFYARGNGVLLALTHSWNAQLGWDVDMWTMAPFLDSGTTRLASLEPLYGQWYNARLTLTATNYSVRINGTETVNIPSNDLTNWPAGGNSTLEIGNFDGWLDEVVVRQLP